MRLLFYTFSCALGCSLLWVTAWRTANPLPPTYLAYVVEEDTNIDIYRMNLDGSGALRLTDHPALDQHPAWSPDGKWIAFVSWRDGNEEIYKIRADGRDLQRLTENPSSDTEPVWSSDGKWIAFISTRDGQKDIYRINPDGTELQRLTSTPMAKYDLTWSPDSQFVIYTANVTGFWEIYLASSKGRQIAQTLISNGYNNLFLNWTPYQRGFTYVARRVDDFRIYFYDWDWQDSYLLWQSSESEIIPRAASLNEFIMTDSYQDPTRLIWQNHETQYFIDDEFINSMGDLIWSSDYRAIIYTRFNGQGSSQLFEYDSTLQRQQTLSDPSQNYVQPALPPQFEKKWHPWPLILFIALAFGIQQIRWQNHS